MKITVLAENTTQGDFGTEHGLSLYIETDTRRVLFDTGQTDLYAFEPHYNVEGKYIGMDQSLQESSRFIFTEGATKIGDEMALFDCNDKERNDFQNTSGLYAERDGKRMPDDFRHCTGTEQYQCLSAYMQKLHYISTGQTITL